jgi:hypothetical protein
MESITVKLAGIVVRLDLTYDENIQRFLPYITNDEEEGHLVISPSRLTEEVRYLEGNKSVRHISKVDAENNAIYRDLTDFLWDHNILTFHGVFLVKNGQGYIFTGPSGIGKSFHASLWQKEFGESASIINGDKVFLKIQDHTLMGYGAPWMGKEHIGVNMSNKVHSICRIIRGTDNSIKRIENKQDALGWLLEQSMIKNRQFKHLPLITWFKEAFPAVELYELTCNQDSEAAIISYNGMKV